jgi:hypothetical protein
VPNSLQNLRKSAQTPVAPLIKLAVKDKVLHGLLLPFKHQRVHSGKHDLGRHHLTFKPGMVPLGALLSNGVVHSPDVVLVQVVELVQQLITFL